MITVMVKEFWKILKPFSFIPILDFTMTRISLKPYERKDIGFVTGKDRCSLAAYNLNCNYLDITV